MYTPEFPLGRGLIEPLGGSRAAGAIRGAAPDAWGVRERPQVGHVRKATQTFRFVAEETDAGAVPDWVYEAAEDFQMFMDKGSLSDGLLGLAVAAFGTFLTVAIHEVGHAAAAALTGHRVRELRVGDVDDVTVNAGAFRLRLGRVAGTTGVGGYVLYDGSTATPQHVIAIAIAGPLANLAAFIVGAAVGAKATGTLALVVWLWALGNLVNAVANLQPSGDPAVPGEWSDGRWAQAAWTARGIAAPWSASPPDPHAATSVPPPQQ